MFLALGKFVARHPWAIIAAWIVVLAGVRFTAPSWDEVTHDGDLAYLPANMPSVRGEEMLATAFPHIKSKSQIVLVVERQNAGGGAAESQSNELTEKDLEVGDRLARRMQALQESEELPIVDIWTRNTKVIGKKLRSADKLAQLVVVQLSNEFMATDNVRVIKRVIEEVRAVREELARDGPHDLSIGISGSAAVGGDMLDSAQQSIANTETYTIVMVVLILFLVYRAPLLIVVPMTAIAVSLIVSTGLIALLTKVGTLPGFEWWNFMVFKTTKIFIVVILFGAGTDFCLFLIARFREELENGYHRAAALERALASVSEALIASALTTVIGLGMMFFADFGKFRNSGPAIGLCLLVTLLACLTLAPAMLRVLGRVLFWPFRSPEKTGTAAKGVSLAREAAAAGPSVMVRNPFDAGWRWLADKIVAHPTPILIAALLLFLPFAWKGMYAGDGITFDLLNELDAKRESRIGAEMVQRHFSQGESGVLTVLAKKDDAGLQKPANIDMIRGLTAQIYDMPGVAAVRSISAPLGYDPEVKRVSVQGITTRVSGEMKGAFLTQEPAFEGDVAKFDIILDHDPFSLDAVRTLDEIDRRLKDVSEDHESPWVGANFTYAGTTAGIRDLRLVVQSDQTRIQILVVLGVLAVMIIILRRPLICIYLIASVLLSYAATIGATEMFFAWLYGDTFQGLDWKVPLYLFVILVAVGQDYNIYLVTRVFEEQQQLGRFEGLREAIVRTGGIITSCGVIMAGTFVSMMTGNLRAIVELGFALSLGILVDTFVVRPVVVPAFLSIYESLRLRWRGAESAASGAAGEEGRGETTPGAPAPPDPALALANASASANETAPDSRVTIAARSANGQHRKIDRGPAKEAEAAIPQPAGKRRRKNGKNKKASRRR